MNTLVTTAVRVQSALQKRGWRSCLIGGLAVARWGEPRATQDVDGIKADLSIAGFSFEDEIIDRASEFTFEPGATLLTISAEDLIVMKSLAGRPTDLRDIAGIAHRQAGSLDTMAIKDRATALTEVAPAPSFLTTLEEILKRPEDYL